MRRAPRAVRALQAGGLSFHYVIGHLLQIDFIWQCFVAGAICAVLITASSAIDKTLIMQGRNVGLFQHPAIWAFIGLQIAFPLAIQRSLKKLSNASANMAEIVNADGPSADLCESLDQFLKLNDDLGRSIAAVLYCFGLAAFVWNTYQNQLPGVIVPYDFWDSTNHVLGFWITRAYKLYLFVWLLPYLALVQIGIMFVVLRVIRNARVAGRLKLMPFHPDGVGGFGFVPGLVTTPILAIALLGSLPTAGAFEVHRAFDVTPLMGLAAIVTATVIAYIVPIAFLRADILAIKRDIIQRLRLLQQSYYVKITSTERVDFETLKESNEALEYFEKTCSRIRSLSNYPHLSRLFAVIGLVLTPSAISIALKVYEGILPLTHSVPKKP